MTAYRTIEVDATEAFYREGGEPAAQFFPPDGARAYLHDLPDAEPHLLDTGHFATATHTDEIAELVAAFLHRHITHDGGRWTAAAAP